MKTIVLAAGYATRLYPLTENFPKPLLQIGKNTILGRMLTDIDTIPDITEHIIVTNGRFEGIFRDWAKIGRERAEEISPRASLGRNDKEAVSLGRNDKEGGLGREGKTPVISSDPFFVISSEVEKSHKPIHVLSDGTVTNETRLGAVKDLILAIDTYKIDDDILVVAADNILDFSFRGFVEEFHRKGTSMIMCHHEPEIYKLQRTGVIEVDADMRVLQMQEKPEVPVSHWAVPPFYIYRREDLPLIKGAIEGGCGFDAPGNLAHYLVDRTPIHAWPMPGGRFDIGSLDTYDEAKRLYS
ncbi:MAG: nucleotidyltransferase family protein [Bacteroidales bacterium]|nr:nucleotidyltransferase family protein [Bacteroidales bacterium]